MVWIDRKENADFTTLEEHFLPELHERASNAGVVIICSEELVICNF